jgi:hypothetical protein
MQEISVLKINKIPDRFKLMIQLDFPSMVVNVIYDNFLGMLVRIA